MKTNKLIALLKEADPSGELECCIGNRDIHFVDTAPAYYDGRLQVLTRDESKAPYYNITGAKYVTSGTKVNIRSLSIAEAIQAAVEFNIPFPIDYSNCGNPQTAEAYKAADEKTRLAQLNLEKELEWEIFLDWGKKLSETISADNSELGLTLRSFFEANIDRVIPFPEDIANSTKVDKDGHIWYDSYKTKRFKQWDRLYGLKYDGLDWEIFKK